MGMCLNGPILMYEEEPAFKAARRTVFKKKKRKKKMTGAWHVAAL